MLQIEYKNFIRDKCKIALIEIVKVVGSSPREMGSWMLVSDKRRYEASPLISETFLEAYQTEIDRLNAL